MNDRQFEKKKFRNKINFEVSEGTSEDRTNEGGDDSKLSNWEVENDPEATTSAQGKSMTHSVAVVDDHDIDVPPRKKKKRNKQNIPPADDSGPAEPEFSAQNSTRSEESPVDVETVGVKKKNTDTVIAGDEKSLDPGMDENGHSSGLSAGDVEMEEGTELQQGPEELPLNQLSHDETVAGSSQKENGTPPENKSFSKILSQAHFSLLEGEVSHETLQAVYEMGFTKMTEIQARCIPHLVHKRNLIGNAKTGSGKTLAFLIPAIERIAKHDFRPKNGTGCIIITPTRELAIQIHGVLEGLMRYHYEITYGIVMGGASRDAEVKRLQKGINILVATPGRLLDHLKHTPKFLVSNLKCLIIDEADRILEIGFEEDLKEIIRILPEKRQTMLFSATNTKKTEDLARLAIKKEPVYVEIQDKVDKATVDGLVQGYVLCPSEKRFLLLCTFLNKTQKKKRKVMVFFSSCLSVKFHDLLFNSIDLPVMSIHGKKEQRNRTSTFFKFCEAESGILLCTDVAARGLDIPAVDWIIQYDPPDDPKEYIHRVGRTARGEGGKGRALLFLRPEEKEFLKCLKDAKIPVEKFEFDWDKLLNIQEQIEKMVSSDYDLRETAKEGFVACARSYNVHHMKEVFDIRKLDLAKLAKTFGLEKPPPLNLNINYKKLEKKLKKKAGQVKP